MTHVHDHADMVSTTTPVMPYDHPIQTNINSSEHGLHMMMMAVSISFNVELGRMIL